MIVIKFSLFKFFYMRRSTFILFAIAIVVGVLGFFVLTADAGFISRILFFIFMIFFFISLAFERKKVG